MAATNNTRCKHKLDPLYTIFEQHLLNFQDSETDRKTFLWTVPVPAGEQLHGVPDSDVVPDLGHNGPEALGSDGLEQVAGVGDSVAPVWSFCKVGAAVVEPLLEGVGERVQRLL